MSVIGKEITESQNSIVNSIKILLFQKSKELLLKINYNNEDVFLEPLLFSFFNEKKVNLCQANKLIEILQGYYVNRKKTQLKYSFNKNNIAYIPKIGYFRKGNDEKCEPILIIGDFEIIKEVHPILEKYFVEFYKGHIVNQNPNYNSVWKDYTLKLSEAIKIIKNHLPHFYEELIFANKKIYLHDNPKILNFTSVETLGMLYFYVIGNNNLIYFIEELIHQGSHNYLYYVVHNRKDYFKIDVDNLIMKDFTKQPWDYRSIYGAFHGLFTVSQRVNCFDKLLTQDVFSGKEKHELLGRLSDQFARFRTGLELLKLNEVYTEKGIDLYNQLDEKCDSILKKYAKLKDEFDLSNRDLDFRYDDFCKLNTFKDFTEKEQKNYYQF